MAKKTARKASTRRPRKSAPADPDKLCVFVTGDLVRDQYFVKQNRLPVSYAERMPEAVAQQSKGGAWFLREMVDLTCGRLANVSMPDSPELDEEHSPRAHSVWSEFPRSRDERGDKTAWRIEEFLGSERARTELDPEPKRIVAGTDAAHPFDLIVLEDLCLGFADDPELWPAAIHADGGPTQFLLKANSPPVASSLWNHILDRHADRTTVVISISALRARGAAVSFGLSWDQTIEDLAREFESGQSAYDLARCRRVVVYAPDGTAAASFVRRSTKAPEDAADKAGTAPLVENLEPAATLDRFLYLPDEVEGFWRAKRDGRLFGIGSLVTAAVARHLIGPPSFPIYIALGRALAAGRYLIETGGNLSERNEIALDQDKIREHLDFEKPAKNAPQDQLQTDPAFDYFTAYPHDLLDHPVLSRQRATKSDLLGDVAGPTVEYMKAKAFEIVMEGADRALRAVPKARYGKYVTADRQEIERISAVRALITEYRHNRDDKRPLSIAVFGQPGSGKSFAIKQLGESLFGPKNPILEFNLSQFRCGDPHQLHQAFHCVRDAAIQGAIPLVFWDEFDADNLVWLRQFLAPMQDAQFRSGDNVHVVGKAIYVFAGGTKATFAEFDRSHAADPDVEKYFRQQKGPDFISRLRGYIDIKGPNPIGSPAEDPAYVIRRAVILRSSLERDYKRLIDPTTKQARIDAAIIHAFLNVERFLHGARSMESLLRMSRLQGAKHFEISRLNTPGLLQMHASGDFLRIVLESAFDHKLIEALSEAVHTGWYNTRIAQNWTFSESRDDDKKLHPRLLPFDELSREDKDRNFAVARALPAKLAEIGYKIVRQPPNSPSKSMALPKADLERLAQHEHDRWLREHLIEGYVWSSETNEALRQHKDMLKYGQLGPDEKQLDYAVGVELPKVLAKHFLHLERLQEAERHQYDFATILVSGSGDVVAGDDR